MWWYYNRKLTSTMFRRYIFIILFLIVLVVPFILRLAMGMSSDATGDSASTPTIVIITPHDESIRREFADAFSAWHKKKFGTPVFVDYRTYGGGSDIVKFFQAEQGTVYKSQGTYQVDLVWGGGDYLFDKQLKKPGYLQGVRIDPAIMKATFPKPDLNGVALYDLKAHPPQWFGTALSSFGIAYNKPVDRYLGIHDPETWADLKNPKYRDWLIAADPTRSASALVAYMTIVEKAMANAKAAGRSEDAGWADGMGLILQISSNCRFFADGSGEVPQIICSGDAAAGMVIDFYGRSQEQAVGSARMGYVAPAGATVVTSDPIALVKGAEHRALAVQFMEFVLGAHGQTLWNTKVGLPGGPKLTALRRLPVRPSEYDDMSTHTDQVNPYQTAGGFNMSYAREKTFGILGVLIQCSCMNLLDDLRNTRQVILASPHAARLDARLGRFSFDQKEALRRAAVYKTATPVAKLEMERKWTEQFRTEYRELRAAARK